MEMKLESLHELLKFQSDKTEPIDDLERMRKEIIECLAGLTDAEILDKSKYPLPVKAYSLALKHGGAFDAKLIANRVRIIADVIEFNNDVILITGKSRIELLGDQYDIYVIDSKGNRFELAYQEASFNDYHGIDGTVFFKGCYFTVALPVKNGIDYGFVLKSKDSGVEKAVEMHASNFSNISTAKRNIFVYDNHIIKYRDKKIKIEKRTALKEYSEKKKFELMLKKARRNDLFAIRKKAEELKSGKPIWLIYDRTEKGDDNGEALFRFLMNCDEAKDINIFYAIAKDCEDYDRIKHYGPVIDMESEEFKIYFLAADKVISSQWAMWALNPFGKDSPYVQDMFGHDFVFLQHGITKDDVSDFGNKTKRNLRMFVTALRAEYDSIVNGHYGYTEREVKLTGFPRFDKLEDKREKLIVVMPSWRGNLNLEPEMTKSGFKYSESFRDSEYFNFYNNLINDKDLLKAMQIAGYKGTFCIHPNFAKQTGDFFENEIFDIKEIPFSYQEMFSKGALMVTDYSSVAFDFAYMKKPVVYSQFDRDTFFEGHTYSEGYFSYEDNGFGPVCYDYDSTVDNIIGFIENDCKEPDQYRERVEKLFAYTDRNNCRRVFEEIRGL